MGASSRRTFLRHLLASVGVLTAARSARGATRSGRAVHPEPRRGITGARVLTRAQLDATPALVPVFDAVRAAPRIVDGIGCHCGCAELEGYYSLLSCFEGEAMARHCVICQGQARLATRLHREGKTLDQIRDAVDAKFG